MEQVILVDSDDNELGMLEKVACHKHPAKLHRAISVFLFDDKGRMLITQRNSTKNTWPGFWSNAVCSHPRKTEEPKKAAERRLEEELGIKVNLRYIFKFEYSAKYNSEWGENELDSVFVGKCNSKLKPDSDEISDWKFVDVKELKADIEKNPNKYTPWFKIALPTVLENKNL